MQVYERDSAIATTLTAIVTIIGTAAALGYYLSITKYNSPEGFTGLLGGYIFILVFFFYYLHRRYEYVIKN